MILAEDNSRLQDYSYKLNEEYQKAQGGLVDVKNLEVELKNKDRETDRLRDKLKVIIEKNDAVNEICRVKAQELEDLQINQNKLNIMNQRNEEVLERKAKELENLGKMTREKDLQISIWSEKFEEMTKRQQAFEDDLATKKAECREIQSKLSNALQENERLNCYLDEKVRELKDVILVKDRVAFDLKISEDKIAHLNKEITQLNDVITVKMDNVQHWQVKYFEIEKSIASFAGLRDENQLLRGKNSDLERSLQSLSSENARLSDNLRAVSAENEENKETVADLEAKVIKDINLNNKILFD